MFSYAVYTFSFNRLTPVRYLSECSRDSCDGINISVIDTVRPRLLCVLGKLCKLVPYIGLANGRGEERRGEGAISMRGCARTRSSCVCACPSYVCVRAFASCGFVVCPEGRTTSCLRSLVLFASLRPSPIRRDLTPHRPSSSRFPPPRSSTHRSPACV